METYLRKEIQNASGHIHVYANLVKMLYSQRPCPSQLRKALQDQLENTALLTGEPQRER
ncbi:hypothetical protein P7K49_007382 [Saguinus oedipus]|uniref:Uncharacterized protein n=1 Tax=Saguinus oedipus TaxID=9490 RepID=A0ABQ9VUP7_SAGOE|nr:hypothetical protein P7K49_007382 [Saguinus oedipus]